MTTLIAFPIVTLMVLVCYRLLTGQIDTAGLLRDQTGAVSPARIQMLAISTLGVGFYALDSFGPVTNPNAVRDVPPELLALLGSSHGLYLFRKWLTARINGETSR